MLKACCDCIAGNQGAGRDEDPYRVHLNGRQTRQRQWHTHTSDNMAVIPTPTLRVGNLIIMKGRMTDDQRLRVEVGSNNGLICYINVVNRPNETDAEDLFELIKNGEVIFRSSASSMLDQYNPTQYELRFSMKQSPDYNAFIEILFNGSMVETVLLDNIEDIAFVSASGQLEEFTYLFQSS